MSKEIYECCLMDQLIDPSWVESEVPLPTSFIPIESDSYEQAAKVYAANFHEKHPAFFEGTIRVRILCRKEHKDFKVVASPAVTFKATPVQEKRS